MINKRYWENVICIYRPLKAATGIERDKENMRVVERHEEECHTSNYMENTLTFITEILRGIWLATTEWETWLQEYWNVMGVYEGF